MTAVAETSGLSRIAQIAVVIHDLPRAVAFYRDTLGMRLLFEAQPMMAFFDCAGVRLMLSLPSAPEHDHPSSIIYYAVEDIQASAQALAGKGVVFEQQPHVVASLPHADVWIAAFRDPDGNILELMSEVANA
jgi:catechol 2,3-dioxygenase-like lactoylglutathione lyase family enzyme